MVARFRNFAAISTIKNDAPAKGVRIVVATATRVTARLSAPKGCGKYPDKNAFESQISDLLPPCASSHFSTLEPVPLDIESGKMKPGRQRSVLQASNAQFEFSLRNTPYG